jgi:dimethylargininase
MFTRAIVCPPSANFSQGLTTSDLGQPDYEAALAQHHAYCVALEDCGLTLFKLSADPAYPDSTFVEDTAVLIEPAGGNPAEYQAVITTPGALSRRGETSAIRQTLLNFFPSLHEIHAPGTLDGGDICQAGWHFFIGISERTNEAGAQQLVEHLARMDYSASLIDIRNTPELLHLKSGIAYLGDGCLVVVEAIAGHAAFTEYDRISIEADEMYAANCIRINDHVLIAAGYPKFEQALAERGHHTVALKMSEFQKMDGGLSCLSLRF